MRLGDEVSFVCTLGTCPDDTHSGVIIDSDRVTYPYPAEREVKQSCVWLDDVEGPLGGHAWWFNDDELTPV